MPWACLDCGGHGAGRVAEGMLVCRLCGARRPAEIRPLRIVSGAAAAGKSSVGAALAGLPGIVALDVDVVAAGAAAVADRRADYLGFWRHLLELSFEIHQSGVDTVWFGICRPEQLTAQPAESRERFSSIEMLVLSCDETVHRQRLTGRAGGSRAAARASFHSALNLELRSARDGDGIRIRHLDTTTASIEDTARATADWIRSTARSAPGANPQPSRHG